jgi:predicted nuclease of predicted toxin-antitoxin system
VKIKLDENVHGDVRNALVTQGHDVRTAHEEGLAGRPDADVAAAVKGEIRCLVTFDLDFADPRRFPPAGFAGLVVLRLRIPTARLQVERVRRFFDEMPEVVGKLWILEEARARDWTP